MKKKYVFVIRAMCLFIACCFSVAMRASDALIPVEGGVYFIQSVGGAHDGELVGLHPGTEYLTMAAAEYGENQQFEFIAAGTDSQGHDLFTIRLLSNGLFVAKESYFSRLREVGTKFWIEEVESSGEFYICIRNENSSEGLGLDSGNNGVWSNKGGTGNLRNFLLIEVSENIQVEVALANLAKAIIKAEETLNISGDYPDDTKNALQTAIEIAKNITDEFTVEEIRSVINDLNVKVQLYIDSELTPELSPKSGVRYRIFMSTTNSGTDRKYIGTVNHYQLISQTLLEDESADDQLWYFEAVEGETDTYLIKSACVKHTDGGKYMNGWPQTESGSAVNAVKWVAKYAATKDDGVNYFSFSNPAGQYMNFQNGGNPGSAIWNDGDGMGHASLLAIEAIVPVKNELKAKLEECRLFYNSTEEGTAAGQYPKAAREKFQNAIETAQTLFGEDATQEEVDLATDVLNDALEEYKDSVSNGIPSGMNEIASIPFISAFGKELNILNLNGKTLIEMYDLSGKLVLSDTTTALQYKRNISFVGSFIVKVKYMDGVISKIINVK